MSRPYLLLYNIVLAAGWSSIAWAAVREYSQSGELKHIYRFLIKFGKKVKLFDRVVEKSLFLFQSAAILEVLHCVLGLVRSSVIITLLQGMGFSYSRLSSLFSTSRFPSESLAMKLSKASTKVTSRLFLVWGVLGPVPRTHNSPGFILLLTAWSITEVLRYRYEFQY